MNFKKLILLTIALCFVFVSLVGCGCNNHEHDDDVTEASSETTIETVETTEATEPTESTINTNNNNNSNINSETKPAENNNSNNNEVSNNVNTDPNYLGEFRLTAYCNCTACCGQWAGGATASGVMPVANHTIAVDTSVIPFGTKVVINGNTYVAEDTGSAIKGNRIDVYFDTHQEALNFGVQYADVYKVVD